MMIMLETLKLDLLVYQEFKFLTYKQQTLTEKRMMLLIMAKINYKTKNPLKSRGFFILKFGFTPFNFIIPISRTISRIIINLRITCVVIT